MRLCWSGLGIEISFTWEPAVEGFSQGSDRIKLCFVVPFGSVSCGIQSCCGGWTEAES